METPPDVYYQEMASEEIIKQSLLKPELFFL
jgi:hypothetical protein